MFNRIELTKVLYNNSYGGFRFSKEFTEKYNEIYGDHADDLEELVRTDNNIINIFNMLGTEKSSKNTSKIVADYIPKEYEKYVYFDEYDGMETVRINLNAIYKKILEDIMENKIISDKAINEYNRIKYVFDKYNKTNDYANNDIFVLLN